MTIIYDKYVNNNFSTGGTAGFLMAPLVIIGWTIDWIKNALSSLSIDWKMFVPEWIISFFSMPFHYWFFIAITIWFSISIVSLLIAKLGSDLSVFIFPIALLIPISLLWIIIGFMYGFKYYFSEYGFFSSLFIGIKTIWNSSVGFFSSASANISWINLSIGFVVLLILLYLSIILMCQFLFLILKVTGGLNLLEKTVIRDIEETIVGCLIFILILWAIFSAGGILWLIIS